MQILLYIWIVQLETNNSGRYNRFGYLNETYYGPDITDVRWVNDNGYLQSKRLVISLFKICMQNQS